MVAEKAAAMDHELAVNWEALMVVATAYYVVVLKVGCLESSMDFWLAGQREIASVEMKAAESAVLMADLTDNPLAASKVEVSGFEMVDLKDNSLVDVKAGNSGV